MSTGQGPVLIPLLVRVEEASSIPRDILRQTALMLSTFLQHWRSTDLYHSKYHRGDKHAIVKVSRGLFRLCLHQLLMHAGEALLGIFFPIYLFKVYHGNIHEVFVYGLVYYLLSVLMTPLAARLMSRIGLLWLMRIGLLSYLAFLAALAFGEHWLGVGGMTVTSLFCVAMFHTAYWIPYHTEFARSTKRRGRGSVLGWVAAAASLVSLVMPVFSSWVIARFHFTALFFLVACLEIASLFVLQGITVLHETYTFHYLQTFQILFAPRSRAFFFTFFTEGMGAVISVYVWPLFIFELFHHNYLKSGLSATIIASVTMVLHILVGKMIKNERIQLLFERVGLHLLTVGWVLKAFITTVTQLVTFGAFHDLSLVLVHVPFTADMYRKARSSVHTVDEYTALREIALSLGRATGLGLMLALGGAFRFSVAFFFAAIATLLFLRLVKNGAPSLSLQTSTVA